MTVLVGNAAHVSSTPAGAHAIMQHIHTTLLGVGLTKATWAGTYDGSGAGSSTQVPTVSGTYSAWQAFNFSDSYQATDPITVWFRVAYGRFVSSGTLSHQIHFRVSTGVDGSGNPIGRVFTYSPADYGLTASGTYAWAAGTSIGDFARYAGDSLTFIVGMGSMAASVYAPMTRAIVELHIERRYKVGAIVPDSAFVGLLQTSSIGDGLNGGNPNAAGFLSLTGAAVDSSEMWARRAGGTRLNFISAASVVAPIYYNDVDQNPTTYRRMFSIPSGSVAHGAIIALDFSGAEKKYLVNKPAHTIFTATDGYAVLFEWE